MKRFQKNILTLLAILAFLWISLGLGYLFNSDFGKISVTTVSFESNGVSISGWLYCPITNSNTTLPAVALMHGVMNAKETMSGIALELARNGIVALTIDATDHGSSGREKSEQEDGSKGGIAAINFLTSLPYVDSNYFGVVGHSMGVGTLLSVSYTLNNIKSHVFIGSSLNITSINSQYGGINSSNPKNILLAIGKYDELINLSYLKEYLQPVFGTSEIIESDILYGSFTNGTARKLITPSAIHLTEPNNRQIIQESVWWMKQSFGIYSSSKQLISPVRDFFLLLGFVSFFCIIFPSTTLSSHLTFIKPKEDVVKNKELDADYHLWKTGLFWGFTHLILFVPPLLLFGFNSTIIPLVLGTTAILWLVLLSISGLIFLLILIKGRNNEITIIDLLKQFLNKFTGWKGLILGLVFFLFMLLGVFLLELLPGVSLKLIVPLFSNFNSLRFLLFLVIVPFSFLYFVIDNLILTGIYKSKVAKLSNKTFTGLEIYFVKMVPFLLILILQYVPLILFNFKLLGGFIGFSMQFVIMLLPLFAIYTMNTLWLFEKKHSIITSALLNALLLAWTLSTLLPFG